jgi:hypothetical protein
MGYAQYEELWPLPVGKLALERPIVRNLWPDDWRAHLRGQLPLNGGERAVFAVRLNFDAWSVDLFGLAFSSWDNRRDDDRIGRFAHAIAGAGPPSVQDLRLIQRAERWWTTYMQGRHRRGSPNAGRRRLEDEEWPVWRKLADEAIVLRKERRYTWGQVSANKEVPEATIRRYVARRRRELEP